MSAKFAATAAVVVLAFSVNLFGQYPGSRFPDPSASPQVTDQPGALPDNGQFWNYGTVTGTVCDLHNHPIENARVGLHSSSTGAIVATTYTKSNGLFQFSNLQPGTYEVEATIGLSQTSQSANITPGGQYNATLRIPDAGPDYAGPATVSVADMKVPGKARNELRKAQENMSRKKFAEARKELLKAIDLYPNYAKAHMQLGVLDMMEGNLPDASRELETSVKFDPNAPIAFVALASAYNTMHHYLDAESALESASRLAPMAWQIHFELSRAKLGERNFAASVQEVDKAMKLCQSDIPGLHLLKAKALLALRDYPKAEAELEQYIRNVPQEESTEARNTLNQVKAFTANSAK
jgi:tetratricopeptide (TPR) repeat protein